MNAERLIVGKRVLVVGRAGMDLYPAPDGTRIEAATNFVSDVGGSAGNIAVALARQGCPAGLMTAFSDDAVGRFVLAQLNNYGVDTRYCKTTKGLERTSLALAETVDTAPSVVIYRNNAADLAITETDADAVELSGIGAVIVTGTSLSSDPSRSAVQRLIRRAKQAEVTVILDIDYRAQAWADAAKARSVTAATAALADVVVGNNEEFDFIADGEGRKHAVSLAEAGALVLYKMGEAGCDIITSEGRKSVGVFAVTALKPFGAGDAFLGGFVAAVAEGKDISDAVRRGAATAAMVVSTRGCASAMPDSAALEAFMAQHN
ncbi:MAG: PfkB family carbohydrate kinase [Hyphomicrobiales bacterium]|nr:PfkB family carbohydrate kinase [Hyphomicrobiales bacterium]